MISRSVYHSSFLFAFLLSIPATASPAEPGDPVSGLGGVCERLKFKRPDGNEVGILDLNWQMSVEDVERRLGVDIPEPLEVDSIEDLSAPLGAGGKDLRISARERRGRIVEVGIYDQAAGNAPLAACATVMARAADESKVFTGAHRAVTALRWWEPQTVVSLVLGSAFSRLGFNVRRDETVTIPNETLVELKPGEHVVTEWKGVAVVIARREDQATQALERRYATLPEESETFFQWLQAGKYLQHETPAIEYPSLRSRRKEIAVFVLTSPLNGCYVHVMPKDGPISGFFDPCSGSKFDLSGRSLSGNNVLTVPAHYFKQGAGLVIGKSNAPSVR